tara:strand:+ start:386 stop:568 length:183 start_codon:yes stop_codon:yes gene_type:complete
MENIICLKSFKTPKGKNFEKGKKYPCKIYMNELTVYANIYSDLGIIFRSNKSFSKYFKFD